MIRLEIEKYNQFIIDVLTKAGLRSEEAKIASIVMRYADERGIDSHGLILLKTYVDRINKKIINKDPYVKWTKKSEIIHLLDGDQCIGHYAGYLAMEQAIQTAKKNSVGLVFVRNSTHYGASGYYTELAAKHGMIGVSTTNTMPLMAPSGGAERILGNNPISFSAPRMKSDPIVLDIASSVVAAGKLILANQKGESIPEGWALDKDGSPTTDPYEGFEAGGTLSPIAGHKGYGLAFFMDILAGVLSGSKFGQDVGHGEIGFMMLAIDVEQIMPLQYFDQRIEEYVSMIKGTRKREENGEIYLPGEIEYMKIKERHEKGVPINRNLYEELEKLAIYLQLTMPNYFHSKNIEE